MKCCSIEYLVIDYYNDPLFSSTIASLAPTLAELNLAAATIKLDEAVIADLICHLPNLTHLILEDFVGGQHQNGDMRFRDSITSLPRLRQLKLYFFDAVNDQFG